LWLNSAIAFGSEPGRTIVAGVGVTVGAFRAGYHDQAMTFATTCGAFAIPAVNRDAFVAYQRYCNDW